MNDTNDRVRGIWDRIRQKEALAAAGRKLCAQTAWQFPPPKLWVSAVCGLAVAVTPIVAAAGERIGL